MTTPNKEAILEHAKELYFKDNPDAPTPEEHELVESGYCYEAQNQLMRNDTSFELYLEEQAAQNGYRLVTEEEHSKLIELESAKEQANKERKKTKRLQEELERIRFEEQKKETKPQEALPLNLQEALRSGFYVTGTTGTGKSDIAMYAADKLMKHNVVVVVFDSTQDWIERSSIPYYQTLRSTSIVEIPKQSMIFDICKLYPQQRQRFVERFCGLLYQYQADKPKHLRKQYFLIFEEAQTYLWQNSLRSEKARNTTMMLTEGRNYAVRFGCVVQFSSMIDKNAMRYMKQRYLGWTNEKNDVEYLRSFIGNKVGELKKLKAGEFMYSNPSENTLKKIAIQPFSTEKKPRKIENLQSRLEQPIKKKTQHIHDNNGKIIHSLIIGLIGFVLIMVALSQRV